jgi:hypothetical protein
VFIRANLVLRLASEPAMIPDIDVKPPGYPPETDDCEDAFPPRPATQGPMHRNLGRMKGDIESDFWFWPPNAVW